ncbi:MAG: hypothetical protein V7K27_26375 [Nostoc sp.]
MLNQFYRVRQEAEGKDTCQLNVKVSLEAAFRDYLVKSLRLGMPVVEAPPQDLRQSRDEVHFQPLAGNEVIKGFHVKLTPMEGKLPSIPCPDQSGKGV